MNYKRLFPLLLLCVKTAICASDGIAIPSSSQLQGDLLVNAVREGAQQEYKHALATVENPAKKVAYYCPLRERIAKILPIRICIDAIFDREEADSMALIAAVDESIVQRAPQVLQQPCFRRQLPFAYAYDKLTDGYWLDRDAPFVAPLFTLLAGNAQLDSRLIALQLTSQDKRWYDTAIKTIRQHPIVLKNLHHTLMALDQPTLAAIMLSQEPLKSTVGEVAVQLTCPVNPEVAYNHMRQLLARKSEESFNGKKAKPIYDMQEAKDNLLMWIADNPLVPTEFLSNLLRHEADPYAEMGQKGAVTPIEQMLHTALDVPGNNSRTEFFAINKLQEMLLVSELASVRCKLRKKKFNDPHWADEVQGRMRRTIGRKFQERGIEPFLENLVLWENIVTSLGVEKESQRRMVYNLVCKNSTMRSVQGSPFRQFCIAMQIQNFCSLVAHNLTSDTSVIDLYYFLTFGIEQQFFDQDNIKDKKNFTLSLYKTLDPGVCAQIDLIIEQNKSA